jgi:hypothetical protein
MPDIEAIEVLTQAKERLFENGWGTGGPLCYPEDSTIICLEESVAGRGHYIQESCSPAVGRAGNYLREVIDTSVIWAWNDTQESASPVFDAIDNAIGVAKETDVC